MEKLRIYLLLLLLLLDRHCDPIACSLLGDGVPSQNIGYRGSRICPYIVLGYYLSTPLLQSLPGFSSCDTTSPYCASSPSDSASALYFAPSRSRPSCYHNRLDTHAPGLQKYCSQRSRIGRVAIYCTAVFCLLVT